MNIETSAFKLLCYKGKKVTVQEVELPSHWIRKDLKIFIEILNLVSSRGSYSKVELVFDFEPDAYIQEIEVEANSP